MLSILAEAAVLSFVFLFLPLWRSRRQELSRAALLPITYLADGLRQASLYPVGFVVIGKDIFILAVWLIVMLAATLSVFRLKE